MIYVKIFKNVVQSTALKVIDVMHIYIDKKFDIMLPKNPV